MKIRTDAITQLHATYVLTGRILTRGLVLTLLLSACGGGGKGTDATASPVLPASSQKTTEAASSLPVQSPRSADSFVDAIGVNTHLGYGNTAYVSAWSKVQASLLSLGVRHIRDGLVDTTWQPYYDHLNALGSAGIHAELVTSPKESPSLLLAYPSRVSAGLEAYEGPNEYNDSGDPNWALDLTSFQTTLYGTIRGNAATSRYPVIGPSLSNESAFDTVGNLSGSEDYGNIHAYFAGRNPGTPGWGGTDSFGTYGSIPYNMAVTRQGAANEPLVVTETGYDGNAADQNYVPDAMDVRYTLRTLLECWNNGIKRTYLYELLDDGGERFGLLNGFANPKHAYFAVKNLIGALTDAGAPFTTTPLPYSATGVSSIHQALFQKRNGSYVLALWNEVPSWNPITKAVLTVAPQNITLSFSKKPTSISAATFGDVGNLASSSVTTTSGSAYTLSVSDRVTLVTINP